MFFGIFFRNSNAQAPVITYNKDGTSVLSYITTGGNLDINFFFRGTAKEIIAAYHNLIGKPAMPPSWSFGW
jgi:alpha-glucosidase (family GH31 glycosyl hydrolase)